MDPHTIRSIAVFGFILIMVTLMLIIGGRFGIKEKNYMIVPIFFSSFIAIVIYAIWLVDGIVKLGLVSYVIIHALVMTTTGVVLYIPVIAITARILKRKGRIV